MQLRQPMLASLFPLPYSALLPLRVSREATVAELRDPSRGFVMSCTTHNSKHVVSLVRNLEELHAKIPCLQKNFSNNVNMGICPN